MLNLGEVLDAKEAGDRLGLSPLSVHWYRRRDRLSGVKAGGRVWLFGRDDVDRLAAEREARRLVKAS